MKTIFFSILFFAVSITVAYSQTTDGVLEDNSQRFVLNDTTSVSVGDTILIDLPAANDFLFVSKQKKLGLSKLTKIADVGSAVGGTLGSIGAVTGSLGTLKTGIQIMNAGSVARSVGMTSEAIENLDVAKSAKKLIGTKIVIEKLLPATGDDTFFITAVVFNADKNKDKYEVQLAPAIYTGEVFLSKQHNEVNPAEAED